MDATTTQKPLGGLIMLPLKTDLIVLGIDLRDLRSALDRWITFDTIEIRSGHIRYGNTVEQYEGLCQYFETHHDITTTDFFEVLLNHYYDELDDDLGIYLTPQTAQRRVEFLAQMIEDYKKQIPEECRYDVL